MPGTADLLEGVNALEAAREGYLQAATYFRGTPAERFASTHIERLVRGSGPYRFRLAHRPVLAMANRCRIAAITSDRDEATAAIDRLRQANDMQIQEGFIHRETFLYGDAYALVWPVTEEEDASPAPDGEQVDIPVDSELLDTGVEITYQSPLSCRVMYSGQDGRRVRFAIRRWRETDALGQNFWRAELWYPGDPSRLENWITLPDAPGKTPEEWVEYAEDLQGQPVPATPDNWPIVHDWGVPIKHARTDLPYGRPEHIDAYGPQDAINKMLITQVSGVEAYSWPDRYRLIDDAAVLDQTRDAVDWQDDEDAPQADQPVRRAGAGGAGGIEHEYTGTKAVGQFNVPDPRPLGDSVELYMRLMSGSTSTPLSEFNPEAYGGGLSGEARKEADKPTRDREQDRKLYLEGFWREVWTLALQMAGVESGSITVQWAPGEVNTDPDWWQTAQTRLAMGIPLRQILLEANYLPDEIDEWLKADNDEAALDQRIARLTALGAALQGIGTAQALGVVSAEQVSVLVNQIMGQAGVPEGAPADVTPPQPQLPPGADQAQQDQPQEDA